MRMRMNTKKGLIVPALVLGGALAIGMPVLAASDAFKQKAQEFYDRHCTRGRATSIIATLCYLFDKVKELDQDFTKLTDRVGDLEQMSEKPSKAVRVFDGTGQEIGIIVGSESGGTFLTLFSTTLDRMMFLREHTPGGVKHVFTIEGRGIAAFFTRPNCEGDPYIPLAPTDMELSAFLNWLLMVGPGRYYVVDRGSPSLEADSESRLEVDGDGVRCVEDKRPWNLRPLRPVDLPNPVSVPLEYHYR